MPAPARPQGAIEEMAGAAAEVIIAATRGGLRVAYLGGRAGLSAAGTMARLPVVGPRLFELNRRWRVDRAALSHRLDALTREAVSLLVNSVLDGLDLTSMVVERIDIDRITDQVDIERILARVDVDSVVARADLDLVLARIDVVAIARDVIEELDLPEMIRESSGSLAAETLDGLRLQGMQADQLVTRVIDRILLRKGGRGASPLEPSGPRDALAGT
jgi:hypothetical protein